MIQTVEECKTFMKMSAQLDDEVMALHKKLDQLQEPIQKQLDELKQKQGALKVQIAGFLQKQSADEFNALFENLEEGRVDAACEHKGCNSPEYSPEAATTIQSVEECKKSMAINAQLDDQVLALRKQLDEMLKRQGALKLSIAEFVHSRSSDEFNALFESHVDGRAGTVDTVCTNAGTWAACNYRPVQASVAF